MHKGAYAKRKAEAIAEIGRKTGIDLSPGSLGHKAPSVEIRDLFQLEKIARELPEQRPEDAEIIAIDEAVEIIGGVKGVGVSLTAKIEKALRE